MGGGRERDTGVGGGRERDTGVGGGERERERGDRCVCELACVHLRVTTNN